MVINTYGVINNYTVTITAIVFMLLLFRIIKIKKRGLYTFLSGFLLLIFYFIGWEYLDYDNSSKEIGKNVIFFEPMYEITNVKRSYAGDAIMKKYDRYIVSKNEVSGGGLYNIGDENVKCLPATKSYYIIDTFYSIEMGVLPNTFGASTLKFIVLKDEEGKEYVQYKSIYE